MAGLKKGQTHSGSFVKNDPRRWTGGRPINKNKVVLEKALQEETTELCIKTLSEAIADSKAPWKDRLQAVETALNFGHGKPVDRVLMAKVGDESSSKAQAIQQLLQVLDAPQGDLEDEEKDLDNTPPQNFSDIEIEDGEIIEGG